MLGMRRATAPLQRALKGLPATGHTEVAPSLSQSPMSYADAPRLPMLWRRGSSGDGRSGLPAAKVLYQQFKLGFERGQGAQPFGSDGKTYFDAHCSYGVTLFGHSTGDLFEPVLERIIANRLPISHGAFRQAHAEPAAQALVAQTLASLPAPTTPWQVYFTNTGAEAIDSAIKFARLWGARHKGLDEHDKLIFGIEGAFHGRTIGATSLFDRGRSTYRAGFEPLLSGIRHLPFNDPTGLEALRRHADRTAAVIIEPIQGEGGIRVPSAEWMGQLAQVCKTHQILTVADEVQSGLHRSGPFWASAHFQSVGFVPDIITSTKALGGGIYPVAAVVMQSHVADLIQPGMHGSTLGGNNIATAVAAHTLKPIDTLKIADNVAQQSRRLDEWLKTIRVAHRGLVRECSGAGLWRGIRLDPTLSLHHVAQTLLEHGLITGQSGGTVLRFAPPLNVTNTGLACMVERLDAALRDIGRHPSAHRA